MNAFLLICCLSIAALGAGFLCLLHKGIDELFLKFGSQRSPQLDPQAINILQDAGYQVRKRHKQRRVSMFVDGRKVSFDISPDAFAMKDNRNYLVKVRRGGPENDVTHPEIRRELIEDFHNFPVDGILLVNLDRYNVNNIRFTYKALRKTKYFFMIIMAFFLGLLFALILLEFKSNVS